ncbi:MAG: hypothetical protein JSW04_05705 [Desulfobacterales bacterium]|nr:MAG: hypothetical protein JSW04_05705 [Desulfobacterales bacterium]
MTYTIEKDSTSEGKCQGQERGPTAEQQAVIMADPYPNWTKLRAQWKSSMDRQRSIHEGHVVEHFDLIR